MAPDELLTREEVLGGLPARRARVALFLIERQTAHLVARAAQLTELLPADEAARERDLAFVQAFALGREAPVQIGIQSLERYAGQWAHLVPDSPTLRASLTRLLGQKYSFTAGAIPGIRSVVGLDQDDVREAYIRLHRQPLETIYAARTTWRARARWAWAALGGWLDALPPFWFVFVFTFALGLPQAIVAYPIAVATVGPLPGMALILAAGLLSVVTTAAVAEAAARSGVVRYGTAYIGKLTADYLGAAGSGLFSLAIFVLYLVTIMGGFFAISRTLAQFTRVPAVAWTALLFAAGMWLLARGSLSLSLSLLLALAVVIVALLLIIMVLTLDHFRLEHLLRPEPPAGGGRTNTIGIILMGYFAVAFVVQCAKVVLPREPSGRALIWGSLAGLGGIAFVLSLWVAVINGSLDPRLLAGQTATVITPLASVLGPGAAALGTLLILFLPGLATLRSMIGAFNVAREWLPTRSEPIVLLPRRGRLVFRLRGKPAGSSPLIGLSYLGLDGDRPRFQLNLQQGPSARQQETTVSGQWDVARVLQQFPEWHRLGVRLGLDIHAAFSQSVQLRVMSSMVATYQDIWDVETLANVPAAPRASAPEPRSWGRLLGDRGRFLLAVGPIVLTFLLSEWFLVAGWDSFPLVLGILGVITSSIFAGFIPVLLLASSRQKGEVVPGVVLPFLGHPLVLGGVYLIYVAVLLTHGFIIWENPVLRATAVLVTAVALAITAITMRRGAFRPRVVVEMRVDQREGQPSAFSVVARGQPATADVRLHYPDGERDQQASNGEIPISSQLRSATFRIPVTNAAELKVWAHRVTPIGDSEGLPAVLEVRDGGEAKRFDLGLSGGQVVLPFRGNACEVVITFPGSTPA